MYGGSETETKTKIEYRRGAKRGLTINDIPFISQGSLGLCLPYSLSHFLVIPFFVPGIRGWEEIDRAFRVSITDPNIISPLTVCLSFSLPILVAFHAPSKPY